MFTGTPEATKKFGFLDEFRDAFGQSGFRDGENVVIEVRYGEKRPERLPEIADELVRLKVDLIVAASDAFVAARQVTSTLPLVALGARDPFATGLARTLARPGGHITGVTTFPSEILTKRLELLQRVMPTIRNVGLLASVGENIDEFVSNLERFAGPAGIDLQVAWVGHSGNYEHAIESISASVSGLVCVDHGRFLVDASIIAASAIKYRLPAVAGADYPASGLLLGYGPDLHWEFHQAARLAAMILNSVEAGDIPFERPVRFRAAVNLRTAAALSLEIPTSVLAAADEVTE